MPNFTIAPTKSGVFTGLRTFLLDLLPDGVDVIQGQDNRVPEPTGDNFVVMTEEGRRRLSTNTVSWDYDAVDPDSLGHVHDAEMRIQLDIHGALGSDYANLIGLLFLDDFAVRAMAPYGVAPLHANEGHQVPFKNGEDQYENRWVMIVTLQINPSVSTPMEFADTLTPEISPLLGGT